MRFFATFGLKYSDTPHPKFPAANPEGWVEIVAGTESDAWVIAEEVFGTVAPHVVECAFLYREDDWKPDPAGRYFPAGCIAVVERDDNGVITTTFTRDEVPE